MNSWQIEGTCLLSMLTSRQMDRQQDRHTDRLTVTSCLANVNGYPIQQHKETDTINECIYEYFVLISRNEF